MATETWATASSWADAFTASTLDSLGIAYSVLSDLALTNTDGNMFADVSFALGSAAFVAPNQIGIAVYCLNKDGSSYGDGRFGSAAAGQPYSNYGLQLCGIPVATQAQTGMLRGFVLPPKGALWKFVFFNNGGVALAGSGGNTCQYRTYNRVIA